MYPLDCEGIGEHCADSCHVELGRVRSVGFIDPCYDLDINSQESWDTGVLNGYITIVPQTNGQLEIAQLQGDGYGKRPQTNTVKEFTLTYHDPVFLGNYSFYNQASGQHKYKIFFRTSDAIYFSDTAVLITPNFTIENDLGQRIDWQVVLTWRSKSFPIVNTQLNADYLFACSSCEPSICFFIQSITGNLVDNTDPCNPIVNAAVSSDALNLLTLGTDGLPYLSSSSAGSIWLSGSGIPSILIGSVGNYYIDTDNGNIYLKTGVFGWLLIADIEGKVPYTGAIADVDLGIYKLTADAVEFSLTPTYSPGPGQIAYKGTTGALAYLMNSSAVECEIGQQLYAYVHNAESVTITKGQAVYLFGASGNKASVKLANNTSELTSARTLGLAAENIAANQKGFIICQGVIENVNTGAYSDGNPLYLGSTAGSWTNVLPYAPNHYVQLGIVEQASVGNGKIYVRIQNGFQLDELSDVDITTIAPVNNDILTYVTGSPDLWKPRSINDILNPLDKRRYFDDLQGYGVTILAGLTSGEGNIFVIRSGAGTTWARTASEVGHSGILRGGTGTTNAGFASIQFRAIWMSAADFEMEISLRLQTLSDATNRYQCTFFLGIGTTDNIRLFYSDNVNGGRWEAQSYASSISTLVDTGVAVAIDTWYNLKIVRLSNVLTYYINGSLVATISTNVPANLDSNCGSQIIKTVGTTTRTCDFDYLKFYDL